MKQAIAANYLGILEKCLKQCGVTNFLKNLGFDNARFNDPAVYLTSDDLNIIIKEAYRQSCCAHLGLIFGEHLSIANHGFLGYAAMTSPTLATAIQTLLSFLNTRTGLLRGYLHTDSSDKAFVEFKLLTDDEVINRFVTEAAVVHLTKLRMFLINSGIPCFSIELPYEEPDYGIHYQPVLQTPVKFNAEITRVWFLAEELNSPMSFADDASYQQAKVQLQTISDTLASQEELAVRIKKLLHQEELYTLTMKDVANKFCLSPRTLRRHLQQSRITYQELLDEVREQKAKNLLTNSTLSITEISFLLGFHDISNFSKAYKRWTGFTPTDYRERFSSI